MTDPRIIQEALRMAVHRLMIAEPLENPDYATTYARLIRAATKAVNGESMISRQAENLAEAIAPTLKATIYHYQPGKGMVRE